MVPRNNTNDGTVGRTQVGASRVGFVKAYPRDLAVLSVSVVLAAIGIEVLPPGSSLRMLLATPLALLWPGYALVSLLFPSTADATLRGVSETVFRLALGFGTSLAVVPLTIVATGVLVPLSVTTILGSLVICTLVVAQLAAVRRTRLPAHRRYHHSNKSGSEWVVSRYTGRSTVTAKLSVVLLAVAVIVAVSTAGMAIAHPPNDNDFTNVYLATEDDNGSLRTAGYPTNLTRGEPVSLVSVVTNEERAAQNYHLVVQLQRVENGTVVERTELARFSNATRVSEQWRNRHTVRPEMTGENLRLSYLLYRDDVPDRPTRENAYRHLHLWVDVESAEGGS